MANITQYHVLFYGSGDGYQGSRAQITLYEGGSVRGYVRFHDANMAIPADTQSGTLITMHLPSEMFENVIDVLRNETPINYYYSAGHAFLATGSIEGVGEGE